MSGGDYENLIPHGTDIKKRMAKKEYFTTTTVIVVNKLLDIQPSNSKKTRTTTSPACWEKT
jgi:hypothetical protein